MITESTVRNQSLITQDYLKERMSYCKETGKFTRVARTRKFREGADCGTSNPSGYVVVCIDKVLYRAHRLAWLYVTGEWPSDEIDHVNGNKSDNRFENLRVCNRSQNGFNKKVRQDSEVGIKNVLHFKKWNKYYVRVRADGVDHKRGPFSTIEEASLVAINVRAACHQEFAKH